MNTLTENDTRMDSLHRLNQHFGRRLRQARLVANLTQRRLGERSKVGQDMISRYEQGRSLPSLPTLCRMAEELSVPLTYFFPDEPWVGLNDEQRNTLMMLSRLSPLALDYVMIFVQQVAMLHHQQRFLRSESFGEESDVQARLTRMMARDLQQLESELARHRRERRQVSVQMLVAFTSLALLGMEIKGEGMTTARLSQRLAQHVREGYEQ